MVASKSRLQLESEIAKLQAELDGMPPIEALGVRELARAAGVSPTTATRAKRGDILSYGNMKKLLPFMGNCPCCGRSMSEADRKAVAQASNDKTEG